MKIPQEIVAQIDLVLVDPRHFFVYAVMRVLYVSSMQWPSAVRLMRGI